MLDKVGYKQLTSMSTGPLVVLTSLLLLAATAAPSSNDEDKNFYRLMRARLGYFQTYGRSSPYSVIYEEYFKNVVQQNDDALKNIDADDWRRVRPNAELCINFLIGLQTRDYVLSKPFDLIPLDACLGWLYDTSKEKSVDEQRLSKILNKELVSLSADKRFEQIYTGTEMRKENKVPEKIQSLLYDYMIKLLKIYRKNPRNGCHSLWLEAYNDFVENVLLIGCKEDDESKCVQFGYENGSKDSYLSLVTQSTISTAQKCYKVMQQQVRGLLDAEPEASSSINKRLGKKIVPKQPEANNWPRDMVRILQLVSGKNFDQEVKLGDCVSDLNNIKMGEPNTVKNFTKALADYALNNVDMSKSNNDPDGRARYGHAVTKLCHPYTDPNLFLSKTGGLNAVDNNSERKPFELYHIVYALVRITNHEHIFGITKEQFEDEVLKNKWEALYLATFACQIISMSFGELDYVSNTVAFNVRLRRNLGVIIEDWPIAVLSQKLKDETESSSKSSLTQNAMFGRKGFFHRRSKDKARSSTQEPEQQRDVHHEPMAAFSAPPSPYNNLAPPSPPHNSAAAALSAPASPYNAYFGAPPSFGQQPGSPVHPATAPPSSSSTEKEQSSGSSTKSASLFKTLFNRKQSEPAAQQHQQTPVEQQVPIAQPQPLVHKPRQMLSPETVEMFRKLHGRLPELSDEFKKAYPSVAQQTGGTKELGLKPLFHDPSKVKSLNSLYNSKEWQENPWKDEEDKKTKRLSKKGRKLRVEPEDDDDDDDDDEEDEDEDRRERGKSYERQSRRSKPVVDREQEERRMRKEMNERKRERRDRRERTKKEKQSKEDALNF